MTATPNELLILLLGLVSGMALGFSSVLWQRRTTRFGFWSRKRAERGVSNPGWGKYE